MKKLFIVFLLLNLSFVFFFKTKTKVYADNENIYYFTDNVNCNNFVSDLCSGSSFTSNDFIVYDWSSNFYTGMTTYYNSGAYVSIQGASIIFEISTKLNSPDSYSINTQNRNIINMLEDMFCQMKTNGCTILFICNMDETRFLNNNSFLDYVDFHINTDILTVFLMNCFYKIENNYSNPIADCTIVFDYALIKEAFELSSYQYFKKCYTDTYLLSNYYYSTISPDTIMDNYDIHMAYGIDYNENYLDFSSGSIESLSSINYTGDVFYILSSSTNFSYSQTLISDIRSCYYDNIFIYNKEGYTINEYSGNNIYQCGINNNPSIVSMTIQFLNGNDCSIYDNWSGRCNITHKMTSSSATGWMEDLYGNYGYYIEGWVCVGTNALLNYYYEIDEDD